MLSDQLVDLVSSDDPWAQPHVDVLGVAPEMTYAQAYALQFAHMRRRVAEGERIIGYKAAGTSQGALAALGELGMPVPIVGTLLSSNLAHESVQYAVRPGVTYVETEIAVILSADLAGPHVNELDVARVIDGVCPAVEIAPWSPSALTKQRSEQHAIATHKTQGLVVIGSPRPLSVVPDLRLEGATLLVDGAVADSGPRPK